MTQHSAWQTVHVLFCEADKSTGAIIAHIGDAVSGESIDDQVPVWQTFGFLSMPAPWTKGTETVNGVQQGVSAAEGVVIKTTGNDMLVAGRDNRAAYLAGLIKQGETSVFATGSQATTIYKLDGSIVHFTTHDNTNAGRSTYQAIQPNGRDFCFPWGRETFDDTGFHLSHESGISIDAGTIETPLPLLDGFNSYFTVEAHMVHFNCTFASIGPAVGIPDAVVKATPLAAILASIGTALEAINAAMATITTTTPGATAALESRAAVAAATSAISTSLVTISSHSLGVT